MDLPTAAISVLEKTLNGTSQSSDPERYQQAVDRIDQYNRQDPKGWEHEHSLAVLDWVTALRPTASEALRLAARAQHIGRWRIPRDNYPRNRPGYLRWRKDLQGFHADEAADLLAGCGYPQTFIDRVRSIMLKQHRADDPETQTLEDALCLVFIERQLAGFQQQHDDAKLQRIIRRTWAKMSPAGREAALGLPVPESVRGLLERSLAANGPG
jgi:hypothetical protein